MDISISLEGAVGGLNWPRWKRLVTEIERLGFAGIYSSDHFALIPAADSLELIVALTYLADHTERVHFGSLVAPLSFRDPVMLARQAAAVDDLSGGRMILGLGAGWLEAEHEMFGYELGDAGTRADRLEEGLAIVTGLLRGNEPLSFKGRFYRTRNALLPGPRRTGRPPILIGGSGPRRTLPLAARYADIWNGVGISPDEFRERNALLDRLLQEQGRRPEDVKRTMTLPIFCARDATEYERRASPFRALPGMAASTLDGLLENIRAVSRTLIEGAPDEVVVQLAAYADAGAQEIMVQWGNMDDVEGLELLSEQVLPAFR